MFRVQYNKSCFFICKLQIIKTYYICTCKVSIFSFVLNIHISKETS